MEKNAQNLSSQEISKQIENSLETLILCRSIYIIKQKFSFYKERIKSIYDKYNIYKGNYKLNTEMKIYQINKKDFVQVTEEVLKDLNLLIIKYLNPKDIFLTKVVIEEKMKETMPILQEILNWLLNNNNDEFSFKYYNNVFFNKKIKPFILEGENGIDDENIKEEENEQNINYKKNNNNDNYFSNNNNDISEKKENLNPNEGGDFGQIFVKKTFVKVVEYNRRGYRINESKSKIEDDEEDSGEVEIETINVNNLPKNNENNNNIMTNKELSINLNNINESTQSQNDNNNNNKDEEENKKVEVEEKNEIKKTSNIKSAKIKNNNDFLFIESLPLILSDFLEKHLSYAVVESEDDLAKELKILFDKDILNRINDYENTVKEKLSVINNINSSIMSGNEKQNKELDNALDDLKKIKDNIKIYQEILENKKKLNENVEYIEKMIEKLLAKEIWLEHRIKLLSEKNNLNYNSSSSLNNTNNMGKAAGNAGTSDLSYLDNIENKNIIANNNKSQFYNNTHSNKQLSESTSNSINTNILNDKSNTTSALANTSKSKINNALQEIFTYYSKQHVLAGYTPLFSNIEQKKSHLDLNEFSKFCIDFKIPILRQKLVEIFKKSTSNFKTMTFKEFKNSLISLANASHESKKKNITEKINSKKLELNSIEMREKQIKEEKKLKRLLYNSNDNFNSNNNDNNNSSKKNKSISRSPSAKANLVQQKKNLFNDITNNKINYNNENKKSYQEIIDDFYQFLGLQSKQEYRSKMRGYNMSPIRTNANYDKSFLSNDGNRSRSFKNEENEEVNKNSRKEKELIDKEKKKNLIFKEKVKLFNINNQRLKITMDKKMKKRTYIDLLQEKKEEKNELLLMQQQQKNIIKNKLKEIELQKFKEKEHERLIKNSNSYSLLKEESKDNDTKNKDTSKDISKISKDITIAEDKHISNNNISVIENKIDEKGQEQLNSNDNENKDNENKNNENNNIEDKVTNLARTEVDSDENKKKDKNQIWWDKLENYDINDLGLNEEEKEIFINSDNSEENDVISKISNNQKMSGNNSFGGLISDNSMQKSSSIADLNKEKSKGPIQLPPIKKLHGKIVEIKSNDINQIIKSQNQKRTGLDEIKNRIMNGNNNSNNINSKQQQDTNNRYKNIYKNKSSAMVKSNPNNINMENLKNKDKNKK